MWVRGTVSRARDGQQTTHLVDLARDGAEALGEGIALLLEQGMSRRSTFETCLDEGKIHALFVAVEQVNSITSITGIVSLEEH
jgi:hypothetical protein